MSGGCGPRRSESFAKLDRNGCFLRMSGAYFQPTLDGSLESFSGTWPRAGSMSSGTVYQLQPLAPLTSAIASGSWPTIRSTDGERGGRGDLIQAVRGNENNHYKLWPTPQAHDAKKGDPKRVGRFGAKHGGRNLNDEVMLWPTPRPCSGLRSSGMNRTGYYERMTPEERTGGQLNPSWVEWLMGFPEGWTDLEDSETP